MDEVNAIFTQLKPFKPRTVFTGTTSKCSYVQTQAPPEPQLRLTRTERETLEEDIEAKKAEMSRALRSRRDSSSTDSSCTYDLPTGIYDTYNFDHHISRDLPIYDSKKQILAAIENSMSVVIVGSTGCGKSTQVPQMIMDDARERKIPVNIVVTQPRRIAARSIAERVCQERGWVLVGLVGYHIGLDRDHVSEDTRITFCTTGVLLEKLIASKSLNKYTHIILDEVHEREKDMDFLFIIIRLLYSKQFSNVKVILMSATIEARKFSEYFKFQQNGQWVRAPIINIEKRNQYNVIDFFLEDFIQDEGQLLQLHTVLTEYASSRVNLDWEIMILHSLISSEDQQKVFHRFGQKVRKIILSTNIAESSITVPDVKYVIDFCLTRYLKSDSARSCTSLELDWASHNNCKQRSGRAGRIMDGRCYRMIPKKTFKCYMKESSTPELLLSPLENVVLKAKQFEMDAPHVILGLAMDPPNLTDISSTILILKELGALTSPKNVAYFKFYGDLTFMGRMMAALPIDVRAAKLIALGYCFDVLEECIIIAATLSTKSIFRVQFERSLKPYSNRLEWSSGSGSDLFAAHNAYRMWFTRFNPRQTKTSTERREERIFCSEHYLDMRALHECYQLVLDLESRLSKLGIRCISNKHHRTLNDAERAIILKVVISGAFYPNFFTTASSNPLVERDVFTVLNGRDPNRTVYFAGFNRDCIRELYVEQIKNLFKNTVVDEDDLSNIRISFDDNSEKVFVTFDMDQVFDDKKNKSNLEMNRYSIPGRVQPEVYKSLKMRHLRMPMDIGILKPSNEVQLAEQLRIGCMKEMVFIRKHPKRDDVRYICLPKATVDKLKGTVTHVVTLSKFWFQPLDERDTVERYNEILNDPKFSEQLLEEYRKDYVDKNDIIVARDKDDKRKRARILSWSSKARCVVLFIDYGHTKDCAIYELFCFRMKDDAPYMPPRCFECCLAELQPSTANINGGNSWDKGAISLFKEKTLNKRVDATIYSIVNGVVHMFVHVDDKNIGRMLIDKKLGEFCEENYLSKDNHWKRSKDQEFAKVNGKANIDDSTTREDFYPIIEAEPFAIPREYTPVRQLSLKGPKSPMETPLFSIIQYGNDSSVTVDQHSVNSVLLASFQQECNGRYLVAAHMAQGSFNNKLISVQQTTLLPNIRGFGPLMAMIFCPNADLKRNSLNTRYVSLLTGLGYSDEDHKSLFPEHDAVFHLDFELSLDDIGKINYIRYLISTLLFTRKDERRNETLSDNNRVHAMTKLKDTALDLLLVQRKPNEMRTESHTWHEYPPEDYKPSQDVIGGGAPDVFVPLPPHGSLKLHQMSDDTRKALRRHCRELHTTSTVPRKIKCKLCAYDIEDAIMLRMHLMSHLHKQREKEIEKQ